MLARNLPLLLAAIIAWLFFILLLATGAYGVWHSISAAEFTARETLTGRAKYRYRPRWYHRAMHFAVSVLFLLTAAVAIMGRALGALPSQTGVKSLRSSRL